MKNLFTYLKALWGAWGNLQSKDVRHDRRLTVGSPSGLDAKWKQNPFMRFAVVLTLIFTIGSGNVWGTPASVGTVMYSENWGGYADTNVPSGSVSSSTGNRVVYNSGSVTYTCTDGTKTGGSTNPGTTKVTTLNDGNLAGGTSPELMVGKKGSGTGAVGGTIQISGIPNGGATKLTVSYKQNGNSLSASVSGTGYSTTFTSSSTAGTTSFDVTVADGADATFSLTLQAAGKNVRVDDISITVKTAGGGGSTPSLSATPTSLAWGSVLQGSSQSTKSFTISGSNLTGNLTVATTGGYSASCGNSITVTSGSPTTTTITVTPPSTSTTGTKNGTVTFSGGGLSSNVVVNLSMTVNAAYTVNWYVGGTQVKTELVASGATATLPSTPADNSLGGACSSLKFVGWSETNIGSTPTTAPADLFTAAPTITSAKNYYAVFAEAGAGGAGEKIKITPTNSELPAAGSYSASATSFTIGDYTFKHNSWCKSANPPSSYNIQAKKNIGASVYNVDAFENKIDRVIVYQTGTARAVTITGSYYYDADEAEAEGETYSEEAITPPSTAATMSFSFSGKNHRYFYMSTPGNAVYMDSIVIYTRNSISYSNYVTTCCTPLGTINGSVSLSTVDCEAGELKATWKMLSTTGIASQTLRVYDENLEEVTAKRITGITASTSNQTKTISGLNPCKEYYVTVENVSSGGEYCAPGDPWESDVVTTLGYTYTITKNNVSLKGGESEAARACEDFMAEYVANTGYALPTTISVSGASAYEWENGVLSIEKANVTGNVSVTISATCVSPDITADPADASYYVGDSPDALSVSATLASGTLTYLWKVSTNGGSTWSDAEGTNNAATYSGASLSTASAGTIKFKCVVGNSEGGCSVESEVATITVANASYFPNGKTIFIQAESSSAWSDANYDCVKAWFHTAGGSETAQTTYWLFDATGGDSGKKLFAAIVPATGDLPYLDIQRFTHDCSDWRNKNGGCSYSDANGSNTIRSTGNTDTYDAKDDYIRWNATGVTMNLMSSDAWLTPVASMTDQGSGIWSGSYEYTPSNTSTEYVIATNYNGNIGNAGSNSNATLSGMVVGSTYDVTATLDIKDHSLEMSKTFVKGTVHFNLQGHGLAISDLTNVTAGSKISAPSPAPTDAAYDFGGWYKEPACTNAWNFASDVVNETMTLYAKWTPHNFTITYEGLAGASNANPTSYTIETATIVLANPGSRTGYTFTGWTLGGSPITQIVLGTTGDKTITATWSINTPNLAVSAADHVVITATPASESAIAEGANRNVNYNKTVTLNCTPDEHWNLVWDVYKTGESSTKVALSGSGDGATFTMPDYAVTVSAVMTEAAYKTVCFKNNGEDIDGYASVKVYVGESPVAPTLTDGTSGDACDPTSDKHYGWTKETWTSTIATQSEIDERTGSEAVYAKSAALPVVAAEDPSVITYHAVWAAGSGSPAINSTLIAKWDKQALTASTAVKAKDKDGNTLNDVTMTSSFNLATEGTYCYQNTITSTVTITISGLDFSAYDKGALSFYARGSQTRTIDVDYSTGGAYSDLVTTPKITKKEQAYEISNIPKATTSIKLTYVYGTSGETFYFGTVRAYGVNNTPSYEFTELTDDNTSGWTGSDWDGYYIITGNSSTKALRSSGICGFSDFATVSAVDSKISTSDIGLIFRINYSSENSGFVVQGLGGGDYMATEKVNSDAFSIMTTTVAYLYGMSYNSLAHTSSTYLKWSTDRFGIYSSSTGVNPTLYKMLGAAENFLTTCCTQYDISGASTSGTAVTGGTLTSTDNSACEDREVKITANVSDGYRFDSWTITAGGSPVARKDGSAEIEDGNPIYVFDMPAADVTVSAAFTRVYPVTYDANGGTGEMIDVNSPYAAGDKVTVLANTFTKAGYNFDSWSYSPAVSVTDGKFDMPSSDVTITAQWTAKPLNNIILAQTEAEIYDQQYVQIDVTYDPSDIVTKGYTLTGPALTKVVTTGSTQTQLKISATKAGVIISEVVSETVSIKANADETKTASVVVTIKPLPRVHFTDIIHNVVFGDVVEEIVGNVLSGAKTTPTHSDISDPGASYNTCERQHLHLLGWIESTWADAHPGATSWEITDAGSGIYYEAGASINVEVQNGKTFYAVWCIVE